MPMSKESGASQRDLRIYCDLAALMALKPSAARLSFQQGRFRTSSQAGRHSSKVRGRGLNFEELRHYQDGDDVKNMDWRTTLRTGKPHVRAYSEEKERQTLIVVDQRASMFFGSQHAMKSVVAAQLAALSVWSILQHGDRVGGMVFNDHHCLLTKPRRSHANALAFLQSIVIYNQKLNLDTPQIDSQHSLNRTLLKLNKIPHSNSTMIIVSDWHGYNEQSLTLLKQLQRKNDVVLVYIHDKLERELQHTQQLVASDGHSQLSMEPAQISSEVPNFYADYNQHFQLKLEQLNRSSRTQVLPVIEIDNNGNELSQFSCALSRGAM